ncbi:hypothetical protein ACFWPH_28470 [Nocardia sp. NPDC058499]|uniref:hypothetical protein n=1 Tax=Nocardia sp. NPDC058499 TaxID=3346530 RepID=UPI00365BC4F8
MPDKVDPAQVIAEHYGDQVVPGHRYHTPLPPDLAPWYLYTTNGGHSILVTLGGEGQEIDAPVKSVLRQGWTITDTGLVHCPLPYDPVLGLTIADGDAEYDDAPATSARATGHTFTVGKPYNPRVTTWPDGVAQWRLTDDGVELAIFYGTPTADEIEAVRKGNARFALLAGQHALILGHRLEPLAWADTPWQVVRQTDAPAGLPLPGPGTKLMVHVVLVDSRTGILVAQRVITWPGRFVEAVRKAIRTQSLNKSTVAQGDQEINAWYQRYPTTEQLIAAADINERGGE